MGTLLGGSHEEQKALPAPEEHLALPAPEEHLALPAPSDINNNNDIKLLPGPEVTPAETKTPSE